MCCRAQAYTRHQPGFKQRSSKHRSCRLCEISPAALHSWWKTCGVEPPPSLDDPSYVAIILSAPKLWFLLAKQTCYVFALAWPVYCFFAKANHVLLVVEQAHYVALDRYLSALCETVRRL